MNRFSRSSFISLAMAGLFFICPGAIRTSSAQPIEKVDVFFLFDDTGSFSTFAPAVKNIFGQLAAGLESGLPGVEFGFGVGRIKDYGGPGWDFCSNFSDACAEDFDRRVTGRPFYLNQPIITAAGVGGANQRNSLIIAALDRNSPGTGGDDPEAHIEALWQIATGAGFDGNGDGGFAGSSGLEVAGANDTQVNPDQSGDVPPFSSLAAGVSASGNVGGAGFRPDALKLVIIATEICAAQAFRAGVAIPGSIQGRYSTEATGDFLCLTTNPGDDRFGFVSDALAFAQNTVPNAVAPRGAATLPETVAALNSSDIRVLAMGPGLAPLAAGSGPDHNPSGFLSALARTTGGIDNTGKPLVFDIGAGGTVLQANIVQAILAAASVHPGCSQRDLTATFEALNAAVAKQKKLATKLAKMTSSGSSLRSARAKAKKSAAAVKKAISEFPVVSTVCESRACPSTDRSSLRKRITKGVSALNKQTKSLLARISNKKTKRKLRKSMKANQTEGQSSVGAIPDHTNQCG